MGRGEGQIGPWKGVGLSAAHQVSTVSSSAHQFQTAFHILIHLNESLSLSLTYQDCYEDKRMEGTMYTNLNSLEVDCYKNVKTNHVGCSSPAVLYFLKHHKNLFCVLQVCSSHCTFCMHAFCVHSVCMHKIYT